MVCKVCPSPWYAPELRDPQTPTKQRKSLPENPVVVLRHHTAHDGAVVVGVAEWTGAFAQFDRQSPSVGERLLRGNGYLGEQYLQAHPNYILAHHFAVNVGKWLYRCHHCRQ